MLDLVQTVSVIGAVRSLSGWSDPGTIVGGISVIGAILVGAFLIRAYWRTNKLTEAFHNWTQGLNKPTPVFIKGTIERPYPDIDPLRVSLTVSNPGNAPIFVIAGGVRMLLKNKEESGVKEDFVVAAMVRVLTSEGADPCPRGEIPGGTGRIVQMIMENRDPNVAASAEIKVVSPWLRFVSGKDEQSVAYPEYFVLWEDKQRAKGVFSEVPAGVAFQQK